MFDSIGPLEIEYPEILIIEKDENMYYKNFKYKITKIIAVKEDTKSSEELKIEIDDNKIVPPKKVVHI